MKSFRLALVLALALSIGGVGTLYADSVASFPSTSGALTAIYNKLANGITVSGTTATTPLSVSMTQTTVTLGAGADGLLVADANTTPRKHISVMNIGTGQVSLAFGGAATAGQGISLDPASTDGGQGGGYSWEMMTIPSNAIHAISTAGSRVVVTVGN